MFSLVLAGLLLFAGANRAFAKELTQEEIRTLQSSIKASDSLRVDFEQKTYKAIRGKTVTRRGYGAFMRPNKFKWVLAAPANEEIIYDGSYLYEYKPEAKQAARLSATGPKVHELNDLVDLVLNFDTLLKRYDLVKAEENGDEVSIDLKPKSVSDVTAVALKFSKKNSLITSLKMELRGGNSQTHEFSNPDRTALPGNTFTLPAGVKVSDGN